MNKKLLISKVGALAAALLAMAGCNESTRLKDVYHGTFKGGDGVQLEIAEKGARLTLPGVAPMIGRADKYTYDSLMAGKPGYYSRPTLADDKVYEVFFVVPRLETKTVKGGSTFIETYVLYTMFDTRLKDPVPSVKVSISSKGLIQLDNERKEIERGAPVPNCRKDCHVGWEQVVQAPDYVDLELGRTSSEEPKIDFPSR